VTATDYFILLWSGQAESNIGMEHDSLHVWLSPTKNLLKVHLFEHMINQQGQFQLMSSKCNIIKIIIFNQILDCNMTSARHGLIQIRNIKQVEFKMQNG